MTNGEIAGSLANGAVSGISSVSADVDATGSTEGRLLGCWGSVIRQYPVNSSRGSMRSYSLA